LIAISIDQGSTNATEAIRAFPDRLGFSIGFDDDGV